MLKYTQLRSPLSVSSVHSRATTLVSELCPQGTLTPVPSLALTSSIGLLPLGLDSSRDLF